MPERATAATVRSSANTHPHKQHPVSEASIAEPGLDAVGPGNILYLQQMIGNQAVQRMIVARQEVPEVTAPDEIIDEALSPNEVVRALSYYAMDPRRYTPDIIAEIQTAVGTPPTGRMTPADVQAVARKQQELNINAEPKLKIDGMAGPRTLPSVFEFGLREDDSISDYAQEARGRWENRGDKSEQDIARELVNDLVNPRIAALGMPILTVDIIDDLGSRGVFRKRTWEIVLDSRQFDPTNQFHDVRATTSTIYHEARHAEQNFRIAQFMARDQNKTAAQIEERIGLRLDVAQAAVDSKASMTPMQAVIASHWFDSLYSEAGLAAMQANNDKLDETFRARLAACEAFKADPSPENRANLKRAKDAFSEAADEHDDLPHEFDAERIEHEIEEEFGERLEPRPDDPCRDV